MKNEDLAKFALVAIIIFVIYYIFNDINDRRALNEFGRELNKVNKQFNDQIKEQEKVTKDIIDKVIKPSVNDINNLQNELNTILKTFDDKPTIKIPQYTPPQYTPPQEQNKNEIQTKQPTKETQKNQNIKIEMH